MGNKVNQVNQKALIKATGGEVEGNKVKRMGVKIIAKTRVEIGETLTDLYNIENKEMSLEELNSRVTYATKEAKEGYIK